MLFEIISAPDGTSPQWVRDAWIGVRFQALQAAPISVQTRAAGSGTSILSLLRAVAQGKPLIVEKHGYPAQARDLLGLLSLQNADAARWYLDNAPQMLDPKQVFILDIQCCRSIDHLSTPE